MLNQLGIKRKIIPLPFRLSEINCFYAEGENGYILMDTGLHNQQTKKIWDNFFKEKTLDEILITHLHPDHCGYAGRLQQQTGAHISMSKIDARTAEFIWKERPLHLLKEDYYRANIPKDISDGIIDITKKFVPSVTPLPYVQHYFQEGEKVQFGEESYEVIYTPGHSEGLVCFYNREKRILFSTDHILPKITPNISYWFYGEKNPLQSYENSLQKIKQLDADFVIPSHGNPFYGANERIDEIWNHHVQRFDIILDSLQQPANIIEVCEVLFQRELSVYDYQFAIGETIAHMEYIREKGECIREIENGKYIYYRK